MTLFYHHVIRFAELFSRLHVVFYNPKGPEGTC
jgi:hypothetical protein